MEAVHHPWLLAGNAEASVQGMANLLSLGEGLDRFAPFDPFLADAVRPSLGDWREELLLPEASLLEPFGRLELYRGRGFDTALTGFPRPAFNDAVRRARLHPIDDPAFNEGADDGEEAERAARAFRRLRELERALSLFIVQRMEATFGEHWMRRQLPGGMYDRWAAKRDAAVQRGQPEHPLIDYADFTDYLPIIQRRDNWAQVFQPVFSRPEDVGESLQRLYPVRVAAMHARLISSDDELLLVFESTRLRNALG